jgi:hypothetical protein
MSFRERHFDKYADLRTCEERNGFMREEEAKQRRPMNPGDHYVRNTCVIGGKAYWCSTVIRRDGGLEIWVCRYYEGEHDSGDSNHIGWELIAHEALKVSI